jgi:hypothetical protein
LTRRTSPAKTALSVAALGALAASLPACAASHRTAPAPPATTTVTGATAPSSPVPAPPVANGPTLRATLPTSADLTPAITVSGLYDTGTAWTARAELPAPALPGADCAAAPAIDADALTSDYRAAYASEQLDNAGNTLQLLAAATNPGDAAKQLAEVRDFAARCTTFTTPDPTASLDGSIALDTLPALGDQAIRIHVTATRPNPANNVQLEVILVRVGDTIAAVSDTDPARDQAAAVSAAAFLAARLSGQPR